MPAAPPAAVPEDYFLIVSRLIPYKRIDLAVDAFNRLGLPLRIIGSGRDRRALEAMAGPNIAFLGYRSDAEVEEQMAHCRALVLPGEEDFCLTPVEAMGLGRPAIAYGAGGAGHDPRLRASFSTSRCPRRCRAVRRMDGMAFDPRHAAHARQFDEAHFARGWRRPSSRRRRDRLTRFTG